MIPRRRPSAVLLILGLLSILTVTPLLASVGGVARVLADFLSSEVGVLATTTKLGLRGESADGLKLYIKNSITALGISENSITKEALLRKIGNLRVSSDDRRLHRELVNLLSLKEDQFTDAHLTEAINHLIYLANRYGVRSSTVLACTDCVSSELAGVGVRFTLQGLAGSEIKKVLTEVLPQEPEALRQYLATQIRSKNLGDLSRVSNDLLLPEEEKVLGLFVGLDEIGSSSQKSFIEAVKRISKNNSGEINLFNPENSHKLWRVFADNPTPLELDGWTKLLNEASEAVESSRQAGSEIKAKDAFFAILEKRAMEKPALKDRLEIIKSKKCFFN
jgi:hypothetical protein